ncbi:hypothetical protein [Metasolibacillus meyeri]|uniref:hypothetical protein n=1 Tax=Metasolibacillus meyeri TaxID=1071052 RepID=UPI000D307E38|nr:hypothetical protein [Metasolibacillus meyeri]
MKEYSRVTTVSARELDKYIDKGWEVLETSKHGGDFGDVTTTFHIGYPLRKNYEELLKIVQSYEQHGFKEELGRKVLNLVNDDFDNYETSGRGLSVSNEITAYLENHDLQVLGYSRAYYKKLTQEELQEKYGEMF